jgi:hypothetical protein
MLENTYIETDIIIYVHIREVRSCLGKMYSDRTQFTIIVLTTLILHLHILTILYLQCLYID